MTVKTWLGLAAGVSSLFCASGAAAQDFYMGQTLLVGYNFCPRGTAEANGDLLPIAQYDALYTLLGTTYGGDGQTTFALPDLRGRIPNAWGQGPGLSNYAQGQKGGTESVTLSVQQMPMHSHVGWARAVTSAPTTDNPANAVPADFPSGQPVYNNQTPPNATMAPNTAALMPAGGSQPFPNLSPFLTMRYCVVTEGIYPTPPN